MTEPNEQLLSDESIPTVTLAGMVWPVRRLAIEQNEHVVPLFMVSLPVLVNAVKENGISAEFIHCMASICFWGIRRGHPTMTRAEFDDMEISIEELTAALPVISKQTFVLKPATGGAPTPGEAAGTSQTGAQ